MALVEVRGLDIENRSYDVGKAFRFFYLADEEEDWAIEFFLLKSMEVLLLKDEAEAEIEHNSKPQ